MKKKDILDKLPIKSYTNDLEKIIDKKDFSLDTKNLLLNMLYKIESSYKDYAKTKVEVLTKNEFIENIFKIIKEKCNKIIVAEFDSQSCNLLKAEGVKYIINEEEGKIICYGNELLLLKCIIKIGNSKILMPEERKNLNTSISNILNAGNNMNMAEAIRDFNGWSWDLALKEIPNVKINVIFQTLVYLIGYENVKKWIENDSKLVDYLLLLYENMKKNYTEEKARQFVTLFCQLAINFTIKINEKEYKFWRKEREEYNNKIKELEDKEKFLQKKTTEKKEYTKQIEEIDKLLNNSKLLKEEYVRRNEKLPNSKKIFSISHLTGKLEKERKELLKKIEECNKLISPKEYVEYKSKVEKMVNFLKEIDIENNNIEEMQTLQLCKIFLECFNKKVLNEQDRINIIKYIYELRYFIYLPFDKDGNLIKNLPKLSEIIKKNINEIITKARSCYAIEDVTEDEMANMEIIANIFNIKMIDLNHLIIQTSVNDGKLYIGYYDEKVLEENIEFKSDRTLKLKKKTKIFN